MSVTATDTHRAIEAVWRMESARLIAVLARLVRDVGLAEELAQDALVTALERWPESGVPENPGAWLMAAAKHRAIDTLRRRTMLERRHEELVKAGVMLAGEGLHPSSRGKRVRFEGTQKTVIDGPFAETKELIAGFWLWQVRSLEEAVEWVKRSPLRDSEVELRKVLDAEDFDESFAAEIAAAEERRRAEPTAKS